MRVQEPSLSYVILRSLTKTPTRGVATTTNDITFAGIMFLAQKGSNAEWPRVQFRCRYPSHPTCATCIRDTYMRCEIEKTSFRRAKQTRVSLGKTVSKCSNPREKNAHLFTDAPIIDMLPFKLAIVQQLQRKKLISLILDEREESGKTICDLLKG